MRSGRIQSGRGRGNDLQLCCSDHVGFSQRCSDFGPLRRGQDNFNELQKYKSLHTKGGLSTYAAKNSKYKQALTLAGQHMMYHS